jgi:transcriptional antiterminator NusG
MSRAEQAKWYVIHTYSGYESMVKDSLEKLIENNNLQDDIFDIKIPMEDTIEEKNGKRKVVQRKILPCYLFIKLIYSNQVWFLVTNTRGVTGFVGPQGKPLPLTDDEVKRMRLENKVLEVNIAIGDTVKIISGPLETFLGTIIELNNTNQKAKVNVSMFGRATDVEVDYIQIEKINA